VRRLLEQSHLLMATTCHHGRGSTMKVIGNNTTSDSNKHISTSGNFFRNLAGYNDIESYTLWGLIDEVYLSMLFSKEAISNDSGNRIIVCKYYLQAWKLERLISVGNPPPYYVINLSDLTPKLKQAIRELPDEVKDFVFNQAIGRIFENVNPRLYHLSIVRRLRWKLES
jgi:hypothetical protein